MQFSYSYGKFLPALKKLFFLWMNLILTSEVLALFVSYRFIEFYCFK